MADQETFENEELVELNQKYKEDIFCFHQNWFQKYYFDWEYWNHLYLLLL